MRGEQGAIRNITKLKAYIEGLKSAGCQLPQVGGKPNLSRIAKDCGFGRGVLYDNQDAIKILEKEIGDLGLETPQKYLERGIVSVTKIDPNSLIAAKEREIKRLQQNLAALAAENTDLRKKNRILASKYDHITLTGKRI